MAVLNLNLNRSPILYSSLSFLTFVALKVTKASVCGFVFIRHFFYLNNPGHNDDIKPTNRRAMKEVMVSGVNVKKHKKLYKERKVYK